MAVGLALAAGHAQAGGALEPAALRCEYHVDPLGIDTARPRLSWIVTSPRRAEVQSAYRVLVASSPERLGRDEGDLWDTGKVDSDATAQIAYAGKPLRSRESCWWKVRVWDRDGQPSAWSPPARWTMGLLRPSDWTARWVSAPPPPTEGAPEEAGPLEHLSWVWVPGEDAKNEAPAGRAFFRKTFAIPEGRRIEKATFNVTADDQFRLFVNGQAAGGSDGSVDAWRRPEALDVTKSLRPGANTLAISVENSGGPAGLVGILWLTLSDPQGQETTRSVPIGADWKASRAETDGWQAPGFDDAAWGQAAEVAKMGDAPWYVPGQAMQLELPPSPFLRRTFTVAGKVRRATLYVTALGLYEARLNGRAVTEDVLRPGWTDYHRRVYYQTYDVTNLVRSGENAVSATLADGWACGYIGLGGRDRYGIGRPRLLAQLEVTTEDGKTQTIDTDASWKAAYGPIREADLLMGETYDARREMPGWDAPGFDDAGWRPVEVREPWDAALQAYPGVPVRREKELTPVAMTEPQPGVYIYDLGQNMVGWARIRVAGAAGTSVRLRFGEMLNPDGSVYLTNLRSARNVDTYTLKGEGTEVFEPHFTFHGFRYVEVTGLPKPPTEVTGIVVHSDTPPAGSFLCSNAEINQLQRNIEWGQRGNFLEVPTDCPQRDERLGWMGDAQVFVRTAAQNMDVASFFTKWMQDVDDAQWKDGAFPDVAPTVAGGAGTAAWAEAGVIVPWTIYQVYGDTRILERHYDAMARYITYLEAHSQGLLRPAEGYGEWLSIGADTPKDVLGTAYFARAADLMARIAAALGKKDGAAKYRDLFQRVRAAFQRAYIAGDGRIQGDTQADYAMALAFDLMPQEKRAAALGYLVDDIERRGGHLSTGFIGTPLLPWVLSENGRPDVAYRLLLQDTFPGWLFSVKHGATTIWERWDGWTPEKGFQDPGMNSFNHYAFGAVGAWMAGAVAGLREDPESPGFQHFVIAPEPGGGLTRARATYDSIRGEIESDWRIEDGRFVLDVAVPANTTATVSIPTKDAQGVTESGGAASEALGVHFERFADGRAVYTVGSGTYRFSAPM